MAKNPPTVRMRRLGAQLRKIREDRGLTLDEAANLLKLSKSALNRMENAQVVVRPHEADYLLLKYGVADADLRDALLGLASAGRSKEWVKRHGDLAPGPLVRDLAQLEQDSSTIRIFSAIRHPRNPADARLRSRGDRFAATKTDSGLGPSYGLPHGQKGSALQARAHTTGRSDRRSSPAAANGRRRRAK